MQFWVASLVVFFIDQLTKLLALKFLSNHNDIILFPFFLKLHYATNKGAAFSLMTEHPKLLSIISFMAIFILLYWFFKTSNQEKWTRLSIGLIFGGAFGNLIDRIFREDGVIDFILLHWQDKYHWPVFNIADTSICIGIFILIIISFFPEGKKLLSDNKNNIPEKIEENNILK